MDGVLALTRVVTAYRRSSVLETPLYKDRSLLVWRALPLIPFAYSVIIFSIVSALAASEGILSQG